MALKQASKRIRFSDESINDKKFWVLNNGINDAVYKTNPILLFNHVRADKTDKNQILPIGCMLDLKRETDGAWSGLPAFDETDAFAMTIYNKYEAGIINMASAGLEPIEVLADGKYLKLQGNIKAPCLSKCNLREISLVDIASNDNAIKLYNNDEVINITSGDDLLKLFFNSTKPKNDMELKDLFPLLTLSAEATITDVMEAIKKQNTEVVTLKAENTKISGELVALKAANDQAKVDSLVDEAVTAKKIAAADKPHYTKLAAADFETTKTILDAMKPYESLETKLSSDDVAVNAVEVAELLKLSGSELFNQGKLDRLRVLSPVHYKLKYKEAFDALPAEEKK